MNETTPLAVVENNQPVPVAIDSGIEQLRSIVLNTLSSTIRGLSGSGEFGISPDGKRDYNILFGYGQDLRFEDYYSMFRRSGIAGTVIEKVAKSCWRDRPVLKVGEKEVLTKELTELINRGLFKGLERADILNRIGIYSVMFIGIPDGQKASEPLGKSARKLDGLYFNAYSEPGSVINSYVTEESDPRWGLPELYQLQTMDFGDKRKTQNVKAQVVHWQRVVHMAEGALDSPIEGASALEGVWNDVIDVVKSRGGSAEAFYRNARRLLNMMARDGAAISQDPADLAVLRTEVEKFTNSMQDVLRTEGYEVDSISTDTPSPRDTFDVAVEEISARTGIPIRVLTGKGGGQLAGSEDRASWNALVADRQDAECTPWLLRALQIFDQIGFLKLPEGITVEWPEQKALTEKEQAELNEKKALAFKAIMDGTTVMGGDAVDLRSALDAVGLDDIEVDESESGGDEPDENDGSMDGGR